MKLLKGINCGFYCVLFVCMCLNFVEEAIHTHVFKFITTIVYWSFAVWLFSLFFILSCIALFNKELFFKYVPHIFCVFIVIITVASF